MGYIDAHCHLDMCEDVEAIIGRAKEKNVDVIVCNGVNPGSNRQVLVFSSKFKNVKASLGLYPLDALKMSDGEINDELAFIKRNQDKIVAIGEVGIDLKENEQLERQKWIFYKILFTAKELDKPVIVHSRKAEKEVIDILNEEGMKKVVMHCFSGNFKLIRECIAKGWYFTIPTSVKHSEHFQLLIKEAPLNQLLCETDSPYLHPDKLRNNEPANVIESYKMIAEIKGISMNEVVKSIESNYKRLFKE